MCSIPRRILLHNVVHSRRLEYQWSGVFFSLCHVCIVELKNLVGHGCFANVWVAGLQHITLVFFSDRTRDHCLACVIAYIAVPSQVSCLPLFLDGIHERLKSRSHKTDFRGEYPVRRTLALRQISTRDIWQSHVAKARGGKGGDFFKGRDTECRRTQLNWSRWDQTRMSN